MGDAPLDALMAALPLPTVAIGADEHIIAANPRALALLGVGVVGRNFVTILRQPALVEVVEHCLQDIIPRSAQYLAGEAGRDVTYDVHVQRSSMAGPLILSFQDVTEISEAGQMRRDFVANVSHELRTPLTSLMGFIDTLRGPARDDAKARDRFLDIMVQEAGRMNRLVGDLLSLGRVEADERVRPTGRIDLGDVITTTVRNLKPLAGEAHVKLNLDVGDQSLDILGDSDQLQQVFTNLIENAIKYGGEGQRVDITAQSVAYDRSIRAPAVRVDVVDHGPGIDTQHLPRLTERFYRADNHRSRALGGTGLGLAIVKHILNRHRGRLKIRSEVGKGACFSVILPQDVDQDPE